MGTPENHGLIIGVTVGVVSGIVVLLLGSISAICMALIIKRHRRIPPEIVEPLALDDWIDPQAQKGT